MRGRTPPSRAAGTECFHHPVMAENFIIGPRILTSPRAHRVVLEVDELHDVLGLGEPRQDLDLVEEGQSDSV